MFRKLFPMDFRRWAVVLEDNGPTYGRAVGPRVVWPWQDIPCESCYGKRHWMPVLLYGTQEFLDRTLTVRERQTGGDISLCGGCLRKEYHQDPSLWYRCSRKDTTKTYVGGS